MEDLAEQSVELHEGLRLTLCADDLNDKGQLDEMMVEGVVAFSEAEHCWVALIDWSAIRHASDGQASHVDRKGPTAASPDLESGRAKA
jgi:hypothetical protein